MSGKDWTLLDEHIGNLFTTLQDILNTHAKHEISLTSRKNPILTRLDQYVKLYNKTETQDHVWHFKKILMKNKSQIARGPNRDGWLMDGNIIISYGEDVNIITNTKIHLSAIYNTACKMMEEVESDLDGLPDADNAVELKYPLSLLLHLYQIFYEISDSDTDRRKFKTHISSLQRDLGVESTVTPGNSNDPLSGIFGMATGLMKQMGIDVPESSMPTQKDFGDIIGQVMNNPQTKSMVGNMMKEMQNTENIGEMVNKLVGGLSNTNLGSSTKPLPKTPDQIE